MSRLSDAAVLTPNSVSCAVGHTLKNLLQALSGWETLISHFLTTYNSIDFSVTWRRMKEVKRGRGSSKHLARAAARTGKIRRAGDALCGGDAGLNWSQQHLRCVLQNELKENFQSPTIKSRYSSPALPWWIARGAEEQWLACNSRNEILLLWPLLMSVRLHLWFTPELHALLNIMARVGSDMEILSRPLEKLVAQVNGAWSEIILFIPPLVLLQPSTPLSEISVRLAPLPFMSPPPRCCPLYRSARINLCIVCRSAWGIRCRDDDGQMPNPKRH